MKAGKCLIAAGDADLRKIEKLKGGQVIEATVKQSRSTPLNRFFWAMAGWAWENYFHENFGKVEYFVKAVEMEVDFTEVSKDLHGKIYKVPRSLSFNETDNIDFLWFVERFKELVEAKSGVSIDEALEEEGMRFSQIKADYLKNKNKNIGDKQ